MIVRLGKLLEGSPLIARQIEEELKVLPVWTPIPGPQLEAFESEADILYFGGAAGGSKSDLLLGLSLTQHRQSLILRREATQTQALIDRMTEILGSRDGYNSQHLIWRLTGRQVEFGSCPNPGDELKWQGRPHDLLAFDEIPLFLLSQFRFLQTWLRSTISGQRCRIVCTGNPPTTQDGRWVIDYWAPWLDDKHPKPALSGELRWFTTIDGEDIEVADGTPIEHKGELIKPLSRTFIPSRVTDNPFLSVTPYMSVLQALPEPLRSQMLKGDFKAGMEDSQWQVIPTAWVDAAMARWTAGGKRGGMDSAGVDVARGGKDKTVISTRYANWFDTLKTFPGTETPDGPTAAGIVVSAIKDGAPVHVDVIGVGGSVVDHLRQNNVQVVDINSAEASPPGAVDRATGRLKFKNKRAELWWRMREALDPQFGENVALPDDKELRGDLCAPMWSLTTQGIVIEPKEDTIGSDGVKVAGLKRRLGRSPDKGEAVVYCLVSTPKRHPKYDNWRERAPRTSWRTG
jgi:hypothetical protein